MYTCPMHPEIHSKNPGNCHICGMKLVSKDSGPIKSTNSSYTPLIVVFSLILLVTTVITLQDVNNHLFVWQRCVSYFMAGFFLVFSGFKLLDLKGFAEGYAQYDLLAQKLPFYGYLYPFLELFFGLSMILIPQNTTILLVEIFVMVLSGIGVVRKLLKKEKFQCACLGTFLKVPLTKITIIEDFGMALLALLLLCF